MRWKYAYWVGDSYAAVILAKSFLATRGHDCDALYDYIQDPDSEASPKSWVILTDYEVQGMSDGGAAS